jgi:predicted secreted protein
MKKLLPILGIVGVVTISCIAAGCGAEVKAYSNPDETIEINTGTQFDVVITLDSNPSTGYSWVAVFDEDALVLVDQNYEPGNSTLIGAPGTQTFRFKALKSGQTQITMSYQRSWETSPIQTQVFNIDVK